MKETELVDPILYGIYTAFETTYSIEPLTGLIRDLSDLFVRNNKLRNESLAVPNLTSLLSPNMNQFI